MVGTTMIGAAAIVIAAGTGVGGMGSAVALPLPATGSDGGQTVSDHDLNQRLRDAGQHAGEKVPVYGLVYSDAAVWTLAFVHGGPTDYYTIDGTRVELARPAGATVAQGDVFTGTITITGKQDSGDPVVTLDDFSVVGHRPVEALR
ncbi:hypothetical protein GPX89_27840 [Nocardia sp. ET3-3]|uniref:Uncharacterized protein n=1 Tax=Nocardia terrae TaxID=2675851 RepID=A0A7K1V343_9NOCA|nr:hypothetical protein [Nocardia terrae]MVU81046.1 hypothetical protein [Nocardia terrae]